jgi:hypothetical protein
MKKFWVGLPIQYLSFFNQKELALFWFFLALFFLLSTFEFKKSWKLTFCEGEKLDENNRGK